MGIHHLLQDRREVVEDVGLDAGGQVGKDGGWISGHSASQSSANRMSVWTASAVSFVGMLGRDGASVVAARGRRNVMKSR